MTGLGENEIYNPPFSLNVPQALDFLKLNTQQRALFVQKMDRATARKFVIELKNAAKVLSMCSNEVNKEARVISSSFGLAQL